MAKLADKTNHSIVSKDATDMAMTATRRDEDYNLHPLARPLRVIFVRFLDIILASLIPLVLTLTMNYWDAQRTVWAPIVVIGITFLLFFCYFVLLPYFWDGKTVGKFLFQIKLVNTEEKLKLGVIFSRELFIIFLPWFIVLLTNLSLNLIFHVNLGDLFRTTNKNPVTIIVIRIVTTTYFLWYLGLIFAVALNPNHQILFDRHFHLFNVKTKPIVKKQKKVSKKPITRATQHVHLQKDQPGNISDEVLKEIDEL
ncbi:RDD family protein [Spiroplasma endosymbiont of Glossina fuscipes fuscipes]|uniref:RDD family protein n=1 Tax=Spiroplasma endosymbiont of Glossina fuscipes fuscipes TaxID=2004463 RepID=UPI003C732378